MWCRGNVYFDGRHVVHCLGDIIAMDKLKVICDVLKGLIKLGSIVQSRVVKSVEFNLFGLSFEFT